MDPDTSTDLQSDQKPQVAQRPCYRRAPIIPPYSQYPTLRTRNPNLFLRAMRADDLDAFHALRSQEEVMRWTSKARVDFTLDETRAWLARFIDVDVPHGVENAVADVHVDVDADADVDVDGSASCPADQTSVPAHTQIMQSQATTTKTTTGRALNYNFAIMYTDQHEGERDGNQQQQQQQHDAQAKPEPIVIGVVGCHRLHPLAECGYMINSAYWGRGLTTTALTAFLEEWWALPRTTIPINADADAGHTTNETTNDTTSNTHTGDNSDALSNNVDVNVYVNATDDDTSVPTSNAEVDSTVEPENDLNIDIAPEMMRAEIEANNAASQRVLEKCGFHYVSRYSIQENGEEVWLKVFQLDAPKGIGE